MIVGGAFSFDWGLVQPEVAKFAQVCTFDPSGTAWSDPYRSTRSELPTCDDRVEEIHRLITKAPIVGPYVLVGFSVGGLWERLYAARYPDNIVGMVVVDHAFQGVSHAHRIPSPGSHGSAGGFSPPVLISQAPIAMGFEDDVNFAKLPKRDQDRHIWAMARHPIPVSSQMVTDCFSQIKGISRGRPYPLGNIDLAVISTPNESPAYVQLQADLLGLSRNSRHVMAWNSTHMVPIDEPEVIVSTIHEVVERMRSRPPS